MDIKLLNKRVKLELCGMDGNAYNLLGQFQRQARREKWTPEEIKLVLDECMSGDYQHLLATLIQVCESPDDESED